MTNKEFFKKYGRALLDIPTPMHKGGYIFHGIGYRGKVVAYPASTYKHKNNTGPKFTVRGEVEIPSNILKQLIKKVNEKVAQKQANEIS